MQAADPAAGSAPNFSVLLDPAQSSSTLFSGLTALKSLCLTDSRATSSDKTLPALVYALVSNSKVNENVRAAAIVVAETMLSTCDEEDVKLRVALRDRFVEVGTLPAMATILESESAAAELVCVAARCARAILATRKPPPKPKATECLLTGALRLIESPRPDIVEHAIWILSYLGDDKGGHMAAIMKAGVTPTMALLLTQGLEPHLLPALRVLGNFVSGTVVQTQMAIDSGFLAALPPLLGKARGSVSKISWQREINWVVSNVMAGNEEQIQAAIEMPDLLTQVLLCLRESSSAVRKEAAYVFGNLTHCGTAEQLKQTMDLVPTLIEEMGLLLESSCDGDSDVDGTITELVLTTFNNICKTAEIPVPFRPPYLEKIHAALRPCLKKLENHKCRGVEVQFDSLLKNLEDGLENF